MKKPILIFDFDGTIAQTLVVIKDILNRLAPEYGFRQITSKEIQNLRGREVKEIIKSFGVPLYRIPQVAMKARHELFQEIRKVKPIRGMKTALRKMKEGGYELGIISSNSKENVEKFLENSDLELFDFIHSETNLWGKHHSIKHLLKKRGLSKKDVLYFGDETRDIEACQKAGIRIIAVTWGFNKRNILERYNPDFIVKKPAEIFDILEKM